MKIKLVFCFNVNFVLDLVIIYSYTQFAFNTCLFFTLFISGFIHIYYLIKEALIIDGPSLIVFKEF